MASRSTNTLAKNIQDIKDKDSYATVMANPHFGGKKRTVCGTPTTAPLGGKSGFTGRHAPNFAFTGIICGQTTHRLTLQPSTLSNLQHKQHEVNQWRRDQHTGQQPQQARTGQT